MNAVGFVKKHGWEAVFEAVKSTTAEETAAFESKDLDPILAKDGSVIGFNVKVYAIPYLEVKSLVESYELVNEFDDIEQAKAWIPAMDSDTPYNVRGSKRRFIRDELAQAIRNVESVGGGV